MTPTQLPAELIYHIFSFLHRDTSALTACLRVHSSYSRIAEQHLYEDIVVQLHNPPAVSGLYQRLFNNSCLLDYIHSLEIRSSSLAPSSIPSALPSIISIIPQMTNLISLKLHNNPCSYEDFLPTLLQQSSIEELYLYSFYEFPFSVLDKAKSIKKLVLAQCTARATSIPLAISSDSDQTLRTVILCGHSNPDLLSWIMHRVSCLTSLALVHEPGDQQSTSLLNRSKLLRRLQLDVGYACLSSSMVKGTVHSLISNCYEFPFTLSGFEHLEKISISAKGIIFQEVFQSSLPAVIRLVKTAPRIQVLVLVVNFWLQVDVTYLHILDWSPLDYLAPGPRVKLRVSGKAMDGSLFSPESILNVLEKNEALMGFVKRNGIILEPNRNRMEFEEWDCGRYTDPF